MTLLKSLGLRESEQIFAPAKSGGKTGILDFCCCSLSFADNPDKIILNWLVGGAIKLYWELIEFLN